MRRSIAIFGCGFGVSKCVEIILSSRVASIACVVPRLNADGSPCMSGDLIDTAGRNSIPVLRAPNVNAPAFLEALAHLKPDLLCNWGHGQLFGRALRDVAPLGCLNYHPGLLPFGRGSGPLQGAVMNDERAIGRTCHLMDDTFDGGVIAHAERFEINGTEYHDELSAKLADGAEQFFVDGIAKCLSGDYEPSQIREFGRYHPKFSPGDDVIDWNATSEMVLRKIRSRGPSRGSVAYLSDKKTRVLIHVAEHSSVGDYHSVPGQVIDRGDRGTLVKTGDNAVWLTRASLDGAERFTPKFKIGTTFLRPSAGVLLDLVERLNALEQSLAQTGEELLDPLFHCQCGEGRISRIHARPDADLHCTTCGADWVP